jgi:hypothetical protein
MIAQYDVVALLSELGRMQSDRKMGGGVWLGVNPTKTTKDGGAVYAAVCPNGYHESTESEAHALFLLVDSFRTRAEDLPETHARIQSWGGSFRDIDVARLTARRIAKQVRSEHPRVDGHTLDNMFNAELSKREAHIKAERNGDMHESPNPAHPPKPAPRRKP